MAKEIGLKLKITSEGQEKVITNLQDLEDELQRLQNLLKKQDFGSKQFQETANNIQLLKSRIEDVDKATEGIGVEKRLRAIADTTNILTGSFQVLTGVIGTLTTNEDTLKSVQEAEQKALNALNIALGIRAINEGLLESRLLRRELLEKALITTSRAYIATAKGVSAALNTIGIQAGVASIGVRTLTTALGALGIPLLILGITELVGAFSDVNEEAPKIKSAEDAYKDFNDEIEKTNRLYDIQIERIGLIGSEREAAEATIKKIDEEQAKRVQKNKDLYDDLLIVQQALDVLRQSEDLESFWTSDSVRDKVKKYEERIQQINKALQENQARESQLANERIKAEKRITDDQKQQNEKRTQDQKAAFDKQQQQAVKAVQDRLAIQKKYFEELQKLVSSEIEVQAEVLEKIRGAIQEQKNLIGERTEFATKESDKLVKTLDRILFDVIPTPKEQQLLEDSYFELFKTIKKGVDEGIISLEGVKLDLNGLVGLYDEYNKKVRPELAAGLLKNINDNSLTEEASGNLIRYFRTIQRFSVELSSDKYKDLLPKVLSTEEAGKQIRTFVNVAATELSDLTKEQIEREDAVRTSIQTNLGLQKKIVKGTEEQKAEAQAYNERLELLVNTLTQLAFREGQVVVESNNVAKELSKLKKESQDNQKELTRLGDVFEIAGVKFEGVSKQLTETELANLGKVLTDSFSQSEEAFTGFLERIINNTDGYRDKILKIISPQDFVKLLGDASKGLTNLTFENEQQLQGLISLIQKYQVELGDAITTGEEGGEKLGVGYSTFAEVLTELVKKLKEVKDAAKESGEEGETFLEKLTNVANTAFQAYSNISGRISGIVQQNNAILLEQLEQAQQQSLQLIGDNTERERQEQEKLQKEYAKKRFEIEKKARVQELGLTLANSIAGGAQAVIQALGLAAPPPLPQIYAGVIGGLAGIEIALIRDQIQTAQNAVFVGRRGGMIQGGTHEQGGVPALLEGGEFVVSRPAVDRFGDIVGQLNQSVGGRGLQIDDSRIVQAISSQNTTTTPIKTYVLYQDIKDTDKLNKRIEKLSKL